MISDITVEATVRKITGSAESRRLRREGLIPAIVYGDKKDSVSVSVNTKQITTILRSESGHNTIFKLQTPGYDVDTVMIKEWDIHPVTGKLSHADLCRISLTEKQRVSVSIQLVGEAPGVKVGGGILETHLRELDIECLPSDIPEHLTIDVSQLNLGDHIMVKDVKVADNVRVLNSGDQVIIAISSPTEETVSTEPVAEPQVIKKGKEEKPA
jgi:large subunit ribosomal protein L25